MIDIHCHILHGLDDGAKDFAESVEMAKIAYADGTRHIIATPHYTRQLLTDRKLIMQKIDTLNIELERLELDLTIHPGHEVRLETPAFFEEHAAGNKFYYLGESGEFILLEQRWAGYEEETPSLTARLLAKGITPIIPHPERHPFFRQSPQLLISLIEMGAWTQVSVDSLIGTNGADAKAFAEWMADQDYIHTLATDAHNVKRKPNLSEGYALIEKRINKERAEEILDRARRILRADG